VEKRYRPFEESHHDLNAPPLPMQWTSSGVMHNSGDILVPGEREQIPRSCRPPRKAPEPPAAVQNAEVLPLFARLSQPRGPHF
jgi:hypothetical protein